MQLNGWEPGTLLPHISGETACRCGCACTDEQMKDCFGDDYQDDVLVGNSTHRSRLNNNCTLTPTFDVPVYGKPIDMLPGCNPIQAGPEPATQASEGASCATPFSL